MVLSYDDVANFLSGFKPDVVNVEIAGLGKCGLRKANWGESKDFSEFVAANPTMPSHELMLRTICNHWCDDSGKLLFTFSENGRLLENLPFDSVLDLFNEAVKLVPQPDEKAIEKKSEANLTNNS